MSNGWSIMTLAAAAVVAAGCAGNEPPSRAKVAGRDRATTPTMATTSPTTSPAAGQYAALVRKYDAAAVRRARTVADARTDDERQAAAALRRGPEEFTHLFQRIARQFPADPAAVD